MWQREVPKTYLISGVERNLSDVEVARVRVFQGFLLQMRGLLAMLTVETKTLRLSHEAVCSDARVEPVFVNAASVLLAHIMKAYLRHVSCVHP